MQTKTRMALSMIFVVMLTAVLFVGIVTIAGAAINPGDVCAIYVDGTPENDVGYTSFEGAFGFADAHSGQTIYLLTDVVCDSHVVVGNALTLDFKRHSLTFENNKALMVSTGGDLTVIDGGTLTLGGLWAYGGSLDVTADIVSTNDVGVYAQDSSLVKITGNVTSQSGYGVETRHAGTTVTVIGNVHALGGNDYGVKANTGTTVNVTGTVAADDSDGVYASGVGATVSVTNGVTASRTGVYAEDGATVEVGGNISAGWNGVFADGAGTLVKIAGSIKAPEHGVYAVDSATVRVTGGGIVTITNCGIYADSAATVEVDADIAADNCGVIAYGEGTTVTVVGTLSGSCEDGVFASSGAVVTLTGDILASKDGIHAAPGSKVTLNGNITCLASEDLAYNFGGILVSTESTVTVSGDITVSGAGGCGVNAWGTGVALVGGNITAEGLGAIGVCVEESAQVTVEGIISAPLYIGNRLWIDEHYELAGILTQTDNDELSSKDGYRQYRLASFYGNDAFAYVWVKDSVDEGDKDGNNDNGGRESDKKDTTQHKGDDIGADTGDRNNLLGWGAMSFVSALGVCGSLYWRKTKHEKDIK